MRDERFMTNRSFIRWIVLASVTTVVVAVTFVPLRALTLASETVWGSTADEISEGTAAASDGSAYLVGTVFNGSTSTIFLVKFLDTGAVAWQRSWGDSSGRNEARGVAVAATDGSIYVTGLTFLNGGDAFLLKFAADGTLVWQRTWGSAASESGEAVAVGADGSVYIAGSPSFGGTGRIFLVKFGASGVPQWQKAWDTDAAANGVAVGPDGSVYVAGVTSRVGGQFEFDVVLLKIDPLGALVWQTTYAAGEVADARGGVAVDQSDGSIYVAGGVQAAKSGIVDLDAILLKFAPDGTLVWDRSWGGRDGDDAGGVAVAPDGTVVLAGDTNSFGTEGDVFVVHFEPGGKALDARTWGSVGLDGGSGAGVTPDGTILVAATVSQPPLYVFDRAPSKTSRLRGSVANPAGSLTDVAGIVSDPGGTAPIANGTTGYVAGFDAALVRITP